MENSHHCSHTEIWDQVFVHVRVSGHENVEGKPPFLLRVAILAGRLARSSFISECGYLACVLEVAGLRTLPTSHHLERGFWSSVLPKCHHKTSRDSTFSSGNTSGANSSGPSLSPPRTDCISFSLALLT